jgi:NADH-quinone oxidoreductase subunit M
MDLLTLLVVIPLLAAGALALFPASAVKAIRSTAIGSAALTLLIGIYFFHMALTGGESALTEYTASLSRIPWVESVGISWAVAVDGMSVAMILLNSLVLFAGCLVSGHAIQDRVKEYFILFLALGAGVYGVFIVKDMFFMYFAFELAVVPMYLLIGCWGSPKDREYAAMKLTLFLTAGALVALVGILMLYFETWEFLRLANPDALPSFHLDDVIAASDAGAFSSGFQKSAFVFLFIGFAAIVPMWPLHTWSPIGHAAAPAAGSMMHAGVLMKLGSYAILRVAFPSCPEGAAYWLPWVATIAMANIVYGGYVAMAQKDVKYVIGFSSSSHMGYTLLGIASVTVMGVSGAVFLMFAHGVMTALTFGLIGFFYDQTHDRYIPNLGGLAHQMPFVGTCFALATMASAGVPGFANFASELMVMLGAWEAGYKVQAVIAVFGVVITAVYLLRALANVFFRARKERWDKVQDARGVFQKSPFILLIIVLLAFGMYPKPMVDVISPGVEPLVRKVQGYTVERDTGSSDESREIDTGDAAIEPDDARDEEGR